MRWIFWFCWQKKALIFKIMFTFYLKPQKYPFCAPIFHPLSETEWYVFFTYPVIEETTFLVITGVEFFQTQLKPVRRFSADTNLKRFQHKVLLTRRKAPLTMGEFRVAQPIAIGFNYLNIIVLLWWDLIGWTFTLAKLARLTFLPT